VIKEKESDVGDGLKQQAVQALWLMPAIPASQDAELLKMAVQGQPSQKYRKPLPEKKISKAKMAVEVAQVVEHLPSKCEVLSLNTITAQNKQVNKKQQTKQEQKFITM
jgi:hypothetical protein